MTIYDAAMIFLFLAVPACGKPAPAPNQDFTLEKVGLTSISLPGNSLHEFSDNGSLPEYAICVNDGVIGIYEINSCFDVSQDPEEGKKLYEVVERLNDPAEKAAAEEFLAAQRRPRKVVELLAFDNGFKGMVHADEKGRKAYGFAMKRGDAYYYVRSTSIPDVELDFFEDVKRAIASIE